MRAIDAGASLMELETDGLNVLLHPECYLIWDQARMHSNAYRERNGIGADVLRTPSIAS
jgi:hypothetical protein